MVAGEPLNQLHHPGRPKGQPPSESQAQTQPPMSPGEPACGWCLSSSSPHLPSARGCHSQHGPCLLFQSPQSPGLLPTAIAAQGPCSAERHQHPSISNSQLSTPLQAHPPTDHHMLHHCCQHRDIFFLDNIFTPSTMPWLFGEPIPVQHLVPLRAARLCLPLCTPGSTSNG
ncbi:zinc finger protein Pegasus-like protein [Lates japonicus]|uniref:Zinc finger protein Pegasus-like protein n=1 Tax=Lates japonicus TaxID=270547 RepID=A0AAD3RNP2_LATJO|nr:zinc finger protein Pegasus-like protein [Lates japonicus]